MKRRNRSLRGRLANGDPNPVDKHVGNQVRARRTRLGMSQTKMADALGLTFQQVQKYENGANRIGASRLFDLSQILSVPVAYFFEGLNEAADASPRRLAEAFRPEAAVASIPPDPAAVRLMTHILALSERDRLTVSTVIRSLSQTSASLQAAE